MENLIFDIPDQLDQVSELKALDLENELILGLEQKGWVYLSDGVSPSICENIFNHYLNEEELFKEAKVGNFTRKKKVKDIRKSLITWVENWNRNSGTIYLNELFKKISLRLRREFFIPLKWHETQVALYRQGDYYKKHLDQLKFTKHRQVTLVLFLNDCDKGGELVIYNKNNRNEIDAVINPKRGGLVTFFSSQIFHEVRRTEAERMTLTTWLRDDEVPFLDSLS